MRPASTSGRSKSGSRTGSNGVTAARIEELRKRGLALERELANVRGALEREMESLVVVDKPRDRGA